MQVSSKQQRRALRRATRTQCHAVSSDDFELLGERVLDLSPRGMLVSCDMPVSLGESLIVSFETPGRDSVWLDAEAEITRIIYGYRQTDPGYCIGLRFTYLERIARGELLTRLSGLPPPIPQRRPPPRPAPEWSVPLRSSVVASPIVRVSPAYRGIPAGVFSA